MAATLATSVKWGAAGLVLCSTASGKAGDPSFDWWIMGGGTSREFRAGL